MNKQKGTKKYVHKMKSWRLSMLFGSNLTLKINKSARTKVDRKNRERFIKNNRLILKSQQSFRSKKNNLFPAEVNKIAMIDKYDKMIQSMYRTIKYLVCKKEKLNVTI